MFPVILIPLAFIIVFTFIGQMPLQTEIFAALGGTFLFIAGMAWLLGRIIKTNRKLKKHILSCMEDAVSLKAYSYVIDTNSYDLLLWPHGVKIKIKFKYLGKHYSKISRGKMLGGTEGYHQIYAKYGNRNVRILYSPKYDEVLLLKDVH
jgi:hypothetical protein